MSRFDENIDYELMAKYLANEVNHFEKKRFETVLQNNRDLEREFLEAKKTWDESTYAFQHNKINQDEGYSKVLEKIKQKNPDSFKQVGKQRKWVLIAATFTTFVILGSLYFILSSSPVKMLSISTQTDSQEIVLSDGTAVDLSYKTSMNYPESFSDDERAVSIEGEGYFSVAPDDTKPFIITAGDVKVRVVGTAFNVRAYPDDKNLDVVVDHGVVDVTFKNQTVRLTKGYKASFNKETLGLNKSLNDNPNYVSWKTREITFEETPLNAVISTLESVYGVHVNVSEKAINDNHLTATFNHSDFENVMKLVCRTFNLTYTVDGDKYYLEDKN